MAGDTAGSHDDIAALHARTPLVLAVVAVLAFFLLLVAFRSVVIPLVSVGANLLSAGAAYGLITLVFQDGRLQGLLGYTGYGAIVSWIPLFMLAVFSIFATLSLIQLKMLGVGLAASVLIDATVVRGVLIPAAMALLGERNWYLPRWLRWLPGAQSSPSGMDS